ncbi:MAG: Mu-like prophage major head subunit gpT family protein [Clostridia bacterium]|nr:Mu-like prophage major head subunit gpT family protein [Clostridia bacterium]
MSNITFTESSALADSVFGKSQAPIRLFIEKRGEAFEEKSLVKDIFNMNTSKHWAEKFTSLTAMDGFMPVGENGAYPVDGMREGYEKLLEHMTWKNSFSLSREILEDSKIIDLKRKPTAFITSFYRTREKFGAALLGAAASGASSVTFAGNTFDTKSADGENLFSKTHPSILGKGSQSNKFSDTFSADALAAAESEMQNFKGDNGEILDIAPDTIIIPNDYELKKTVFSVIGADKDPATANNGYNFHFGRWNVIVWPYLNQYLSGDDTPWILMDSRYNNEYGGAVWLDRTKLEVRSRLDEATDANVWQGYARFIAGFNDWRAFAIGGITGGTTLVNS